MVGLIQNPGPTRKFKGRTVEVSLAVLTLWV